MADYLCGDYHVSTVQEFINSLNKGSGVLVKDGSNGNYNVFIDNDIDFNNDGYYYHTTDFITNELTTNTQSYFDGIASYHITLDGQNHSLTNIYLSEDNSLFNFNNSGSSYNYRAYVTIQNTTFEIVMTNLANILHVNSTDYKNIGDVVFKNCIFNIKAIDITRLFEYRNIKNFRFISCVFNIELMNPKNKCVIFDSVSEFNVHNLYIESCEFRFSFYDITDSSSKIITIANNVASSAIDYTLKINNSLFFLNNYSSTTDIEFLIYYPTKNGSDAGSNTKRLLTNLFVGSFDEAPNPKNVSFGIIINNTVTPSHTYGSIFYDADKLDLVQDSSTAFTYTGLTTIQCKDAQSLIDAGYMFASS